MPLQGWKLSEARKRHSAGLYPHRQLPHLLLTFRLHPPSFQIHHHAHIMSQNQREAWERVQLMLQKRKGNFGGLPGGGRGGGMGLAGLVLLGVGTWAVSNSLFNGMYDY